MLVDFSEAFTVDYTWSLLVELLFGDPHSLEARQCSVDGATKPGRVLALVVLNDLSAMVVWNESVHLTPETV